MTTKTKPITSHAEMLEWQFRTVIAELSHVTLHASDESCPCHQVALEPAEYCLGKHLLNISSLASETAMMDDKNRDLLEELGEEALEHHKTAKTIYCQGGTWPDLAQWSRDWRKKLEPLYYFCDRRKKIKLSEIAQPIVKIAGTCKNHACGFKASTSEKIEGRTASIKDLDKIISEVIEKAESRNVKATNKTFALGVSGVTRYEFEFKIIEAAYLIVSHDPFTFVPNSKHPQELQPRLRDRAASRLQVQNIAANLEPEALLVDYRSIDRGAPIVGPDLVVESGNGRIMALLLAIAQYPEIYSKYRTTLKKIAPSYNLSSDLVDRLNNPVLVRERLTKVSRKQFVEEANASTTIESSSIEKARTDAAKITVNMLSSLEVLENEQIEDALRAARNKSFVTGFLAKLPQNEQAKLVDSKGFLNQDGLRRLSMALFVATFQGDIGIRLAEKFFESTDLNVKNIFNGIARSLGLIAQSESQTASGEKSPDYSIGEDLAKAISSLSAIKKTPGLTVDKYLKQGQMFERELTPFQERILTVLNDNSKSAKKIGDILTSYARLVLNSPAPNQGSLIPQARATKEDLWEMAATSILNLEELLFDIIAIQDAIDKAEVIHD